MKNQIILSAVVALLCATANAGSLKDSVTGLLDASSTVGEASLGMSGTTLEIVSDGVSSTANKASDIAQGLIDGSIFVINNPSQASQNALDASANAATWALTKSGQLIEMSIDGSKFFIEDPSGAISAAAASTSQAIEATVDASGRLVSASGAYLDEKYGDDARLALTGSGQIVTVTSGSVVASVEKTADATSAVLTFVGDSASNAVEVSAVELSALATASLEASGNVFNGVVRSGKQY